MSRLDRLRGALARGNATQLGVGPMSRALVDASLEFARERRFPLMLIASRRQIECAEQGGGYVNGWTSESLAAYVRARDPEGWVLLCRDHGGPWQSYPEVEQRLALSAAMESSRRSFAVDLEQGYEVIHIDPSLPPPPGVPGGDPFAMLLELYAFVVETARQLGREILVEVGTEEQNGAYDAPADLDNFLTALGAFCAERGYPGPTFVVVQTGTLVRETRNIGHFASGLDPAQRRAAARQVSELVEVAARHGVFVKEHNGDYLTDDMLAMRPAMRIGASNVAPELGVAETRFLLERWAQLGLGADADEFLALAHASHKWEKWLAPNSTASDRDKAVMAGHYVFNRPEFRFLHARLAARAGERGLDLERAKRDHLKAAIARIATPLRAIS